MPTNAARLSQRIGPLDISNETGADVIAILLSDHARITTTQVAFANTHLLYCATREETLRDALGEFLLLNDGVGMEILSRLATGTGFQENLNGTDFVPRLLASAPPGYRVFLVGSTKPVVKAAAKHLSRLHPLLVVCGAQDGFSGNLESRSLIDALVQARPDIILVALGNPMQERWIVASAARLDRGLFIGVGALFDFMANDKPRAPAFVRLIRMEWLFRLMLEPQRLWRRYTVELAVVTWAILKQRFSVASAPARPQH